MARERPRFSGTAEQLADAIAPSALSAVWLQYPEDCKTARLNMNVLRRHRRLLQALTRLMASLSFRKRDLEQAMSIVRERRSPNWGIALRDHEHGDWDATMAKRLRCMCRHLSQARSRRRSWVQEYEPDFAGELAVLQAMENEEAVAPEQDHDAELDHDYDEPIDGDTDEEQHDAPIVAAPPADEPQWWYNYDSHFDMAYRQQEGGPREYSSDWVVPEGARDTDMIQVRFKDGSVRDVAARTVGDYKETVAARATIPSKGKTHLWEGVHAVSKRPVVVKPRSDRGMLTVIMYDKRMVLMVRTDLFKDHQDACSFLVPLAERYCEGNTSKKEMYMLRDRKLIDMGIVKEKTPTETPKKRPAAAGAFAKRMRQCEDEIVVGDTQEGQHAIQAPATPEARGAGVASSAPATPKARGAGVASSAPVEEPPLRRQRASFFSQASELWESSLDDVDCLHG